MKSNDLFDTRRKKHSSSKTEVMQWSAPNRNVNVSVVWIEFSTFLWIKSNDSYFIFDLKMKNGFRITHNDQIWLQCVH